MVLIDAIRARWLRILVHVGALVPFVFLVRDYALNLFLVDPVREITTRTGRLALILLLLSLACTPINTLFGFKQALRVRRALGLYAFMYAGLHFLTFVGLDYGFDLEFLGPAIFAQRYVIVGFAAFVLLLALALTSTRSWQRRLGRTWKRLHKFAYLAGMLAVVHFLWLSKDPRRALQYGAVLALLLVARIPAVKKMLGKARRRGGTNA